MLTLNIPIRELMNLLPNAEAADREQLAEALHEVARGMPEGKVQEALVTLSSVVDEGQLFVS